MHRQIAECIIDVFVQHHRVRAAPAVDEVDITDEVDTVEKPIGTGRWHIFGTDCPKEEIVFLCQIVILYTVIVLSIYNLTVAHDDLTLWTALLSSSLGYLLPIPSLKR